MSTRRPSIQAREAIEIVCSGNVERLGEYYSPQFVDHIGEAVHLGHEGLMSSYALYRRLFDWWRFEVIDQVAEGDRVAQRWILHAEKRGRRLALRGATISTVGEDGLVAEDFGFFDSLDLARQLGALRTAALGIEILLGRVKLPKPVPHPT